MALQDDINSFGSSNTAAELLQLAACTASNTTNRIVSVATVNDLPDLSLGSVPLGTILFVESIAIPVVAQIGCWTGLDNRELRSDFATQPSYAWGRNGQGQVGNSSSASQFCTPQLVDGLLEWKSVDGGLYRSFGVTTDGCMWSWGRSQLGALGTYQGSTSSPVKVLGGFTDWECVSAGTYNAAGLRSNGTIWMWGYNRCGRLGDNSTINRSSPVSVVGGFTDWCRVVPGTSRTFGVRANGSLWGWGYNQFGSFGDETTFINRSSPVSVAGGFTDWCNVASGGQHAIGIRCNGTLWGWGSNSVGQLGDSTAANRSSPVSVVGGFTDWCQVVADSSASIGLRSNGTLWAWGRNLCGIHGSNSPGTVCTSSPVSVVGGFTDWCRVSISKASTSVSHALGVRTNGTLWAWGYNGFQQLGDCTSTTRSSPVQVCQGFTDWVEANAGSGHSIGIRCF